MEDGVEDSEDGATKAVTDRPSSGPAPAPPAGSRERERDLDVSVEELEEAARSLHIAGPAIEQSPLLGAFALLVFVIVSGGLVFAFGLTLKGAVHGQNASPCRALRPEPREGPAPDFTVTDVKTGQPLSLTDLRGKFVIVNFWATWCEPCITEWPQVARLAERMAGRDDVAIVAISQDESSEEVTAFLERMSLGDSTVHVGWDSEKKVPGQYGTDKLPDTYFIDREGQLVSAFVNTREWGRPDAYRCVDSVARIR